MRVVHEGVITLAVLTHHSVLLPWQRQLHPCHIPYHRASLEGGPPPVARGDERTVPWCAFVAAPRHQSGTCHTLQSEPSGRSPATRRQSEKDQTKRTRSKYNTVSLESIPLALARLVDLPTPFTPQNVMT